MTDTDAIRHRNENFRHSNAVLAGLEEDIATLLAEVDRLRDERTQARQEVFHEANERQVENVESVLDAANEMDDYGREAASAARAAAVAVCRRFAEANKDNQIAFAACCDLAIAIEQQDGNQ